MKERNQFRSHKLPERPEMWVGKRKLDREVIDKYTAKLLREIAPHGGHLRMTFNNRGYLTGPEMISLREIHREHKKT